MSLRLLFRTWVKVHKHERDNFASRCLHIFASAHGSLLPSFMICRLCSVRRLKPAATVRGYSCKIVGASFSLGTA